ncbi:hypothetical protein MMC30_000588 [Trapelia coarctata]|nr:hypothetical protein [Trapelia coarctata]
MAMWTLGANLGLSDQSLTRTPDVQKGMANEMWFRIRATMKVVPVVVSRFREQFKAPSFEAPRLGAMLMRFRHQGATNPKDRTYALLGTAKKEYDIEIEYDDDDKLSVRDVYTIATRQLLQRDQHVIPLCMASSWAFFSADEHLPGGLKEIELSTPNNWGLFTLQGVYIGAITGACISRVKKEWSPEPRWANADQVKLIRYDRNPDRRNALPQEKFWPDPGEVGSRVTFEDTSWGPCKSERGDIIIVAKGSKIPLILRQFEDKYLFVGTCWLIGSQIDITKINVNRKSEDLNGFSPIMFGDIAAELGRSCEMEEFVLC